jgi:hypothetical protein
MSTVIIILDVEQRMFLGVTARGALISCSSEGNSPGKGRTTVQRQVLQPAAVPTIHPLAILLSTSVAWTTANSSFR